MIYSTLLLAYFAAVVQAANNWTHPCISGVCEFDLSSSAGSLSGSVKIWGSKDSIVDITTAAGWQVLGCDPNASSQDVRIVCTGNPSECAHLFDGSGPEGKIVRLPKDCGKNGFARISKTWTPTDQSIPPSIASIIVRRDGEQPQVNAIGIDTNLAAVNPSKTGTVRFAIKGVNIPGINEDIDPSVLGPQISSRFFVNRAPDFVNDAIEDIASLNDVNFDVSKTVTPVDFNKQINLFGQNLPCPKGLTASLNMNAAAKVQAVTTVGVAAIGTIIPPRVEEFAIYSSLNMDLDGSIIMSANAGGTIDSGKVKLFEQALAGLDFPGILTVAPTLQVSVQAAATLNVQANVNFGVNYHLDKAEFIFPPTSNRARAAANANAFKLGDFPLKLSAAASTEKQTATVGIHVIPRLNFKISALGGQAQASVFLEVDTSSDLSLSINAQAGASVSTTNTNAPNPPANGNTPAQSSQIKGSVPTPASRIPAIRRRAIESAPILARAPPVIPPKVPAVAPVPAAKEEPPKVTPATTPIVSPIVAPKEQPVTPPAAPIVASKGQPVTPPAAPIVAPKEQPVTPPVAPVVAPAVAPKEQPPTPFSIAAAAPTPLAATPKEQPPKPFSIPAVAPAPPVVANVTVKAQPPKVPPPFNISTGAPAPPTVANITAKPEPPSNGAPINPAVPPTVPFNPNTAKALSGCIDFNSGLNVNVGADAQFFDSFNAKTTLPITSKKFSVSKNCFGGPAAPAAPAKPATPATPAAPPPRSRRSYFSRQVTRNGLVCPIGGFGGILPITDRTISAATISVI